MTSGSGEELVFGIRYTGQEQIANLDNDLERVQRAVETLQNVRPQDAGAGILQRLSEVARQEYSALEAARARLDTANRQAAEVADRVQLTTQAGGPGSAAAAAGGFESERAQAIAQNRAFVAQQTAAKGLDRAYQEATSAVQQSTRAQEALARVGRIVSTRLSEEATAGSRATSVTVDQAGLQRRLNSAIAARTRADEAAARASEEEAIRTSRLAAVDTELAANRPQPFATPDPTSGLGIAQERVNAATVQRELAERKLSDELTSETRTVESVRRAETALEASTVGLANAQKNLRVAQIRETGSFAQQFALGFRGTNQDRTYAEQIGQAFKFSVLYGTAYKVLFGITQTLQGALQEGVQFQQAMTELQIATGQSAANMDQLRKNLSETATQAGAAPSEGVLIGARSLGLFGLTGNGQTPNAALQAQQDQVARLSAAVVSRAAFTSGQSAVDLQPDIAAIAQAFGQGPAGQARAFDLDAYLSRRFGLTPGATYAAVAQSGTAGRAAGFSQEEVTAIAAAIQARTGQDAGTVAGYMAQIFTRQGQGSLSQIDQKYGIDVTRSLSDQIKQLSQIYRANPAARDEISAVFGRGKSQNASVAILQAFPQIEAAVRDARTKALGAGDKSFDLRLANVGGQIAQFGADLKALESELGRAGLLTGLGLAIKILDEGVKGITSFLQIFDGLPPVTRDVIGGLAALALAAKATAAVQDRSAAAGALGAEGNLAGTLYGSPGWKTAEAEAAGGGLLSRAGARLAPLKTAGEIALIIGFLDTIGNTIHAASNLRNTTRDTLAAASTQLDPNTSSTELQSQASALRIQADEAYKSAHGFWAGVIDFGNKFIGAPTAADRANTAGDAARKEAQRLQGLANYEQAHQPPVVNPLITGFDADSLSTAMQSITDSGGNARDRLDALAASLNSTADAASRAQAGFDPHIFAGQNARNIANLITGTGFVGRTTSNPVGPGGRYPTLTNVPPTYTNALPDAVRGTGLSPTQVQQRLQRALGNRGVTSLADINGQVATQLAGDVVGSTPQDALKRLGITDPTQVAKLRSQMVNAIRGELLKEAKAVRDVVHGRHTNLSPAELTAAVNQIASDTQAELGSLQQTDSSGRLGALRRQIDLIQSAIHDAGGYATSQVQDQLDAARRALAEQQISDLENLRKAAQQNARSKKQVASIGRGFLVREINAAIRAGDSDALVSLIQVAGKYGENIARSAINQAIRVARAALSIQAQIQQFAAAEVAGIRGFIQSQGGNAANSAAQQRVDELQNMLSALGSTQHGNRSTDVYFTGSDANLPKSLQPGSQTQKTPGPTAAQIAAARQTALAAGSESQIEQARAAMASARADMAAAKKGTVEYYSALGAYLQARNELTDAVNAYHQNLFLLNHDATNPLVQARAAVLAAAAALRADAGKPADVRAADRVALQSAQAQAESTRFSQRLEAVQTAEQLGQTSFRAYMNYLDHEHDRLDHIKNRSYQQQQELNQIDQLLQEAAQTMQGQWNFGDIKLPEPYQVRRYIEEHSGAQQLRELNGGGSGYTDNRVVQINGADTGMVIRIVRDVLGSHLRLETTTPRKR